MSRSVHGSVASRRRCSSSVSYGAEAAEACVSALPSSSRISTAGMLPVSPLSDAPSNGEWFGFSVQTLI